MKKKRKILKIAGVSLAILLTLLALLVVAFVFNPLEGSLVDMRDVVPREVDFFVRKQRPAADFARFPEPHFWSDFSDSQAWRDIRQGPLVQSLKRDGFEGALQQASDSLRQVVDQTGGWIDPLRDLLGSEVIMAGYFEDNSGAARRPLADPWWCLYARVSWRLRAAWGLSRWGIIQSQAAGHGLEVSNDGPLLVIKPQGGVTIYAARRLDCLMVSNSRYLIEQSLALAEGYREVEPLGRSARYTDGVLERIRGWAEASEAEEVNALEFSVAPNVTDGFRRFAETWPNPNHETSMEQRVLASFLNLKGWNSISGALLFEPDNLSCTGEVVLNSHMHTRFQDQFFRSEPQSRDKWLDPFLRMTPANSCAVAAMRMPAGEFLHAMYDALLGADKELINSGLRRASFQGKTLNDTRDLIDRIRPALLPRTGFVFRKNVPDMSRDDKGELMVPVADLSPTPQVAWVFWIREGGSAMLNDVVSMMRTYAQSAFGFSKVYHLTIDGLPEPVTEFTSAQIPGTGEIAMIVFREFFVLSNSGPLIKDILRARYDLTGTRSIMGSEDLRRFQRELPTSLNGFIYLRGQEMAEVLDGYRSYIEQFNREPDAVWMSSVRPQIADTVRKTRFAQYATVAGMPQGVRTEFEAAVAEEMRNQWALQQREGVNQADLPPIMQLRAMARALVGGYLQIELEANYIRFQGRLSADYR